MAGRAVRKGDVRNAAEVGERERKREREGLRIGEGKREMERGGDI